MMPEWWRRFIHLIIPPVAVRTRAAEQPAAPADPPPAHPPPPSDAAMRLMEVETAFNEMRNNQQMQITELQEQLQWARRQPAETVILSRYERLQASIAQVRTQTGADANRCGRGQVRDATRCKRDSTTGRRRSEPRKGRSSSRSRYSAGKRDQADATRQTRPWSRLEAA